VAISAIPIVASTVGANRVVRGVRIEHVCGDPTLSEQGDRELNMRIVRTALRALTTRVDRPTVFEPSDAEMSEVSHVGA
jgi:glycine reductase